MPRGLQTFSLPESVTRYRTANHNIMHNVAISEEGGEGNVVVLSSASRPLESDIRTSALYCTCHVGITS